MAVQTSVDVSDFARLNTLNIELADRELSTTPSDAQRPFRFDALPPELRLEIVEYIIIRPTTISWQGSYSGDKKPRFETGFKYVCNGTNAYLPERYNVAALLITSRAVYSEVAPVFYRKNNFRFRSPTPGLPLTFTNPLFTQNLYHLTIGIPFSGLSEPQLKRTDKLNGARVREITRLCPALRTFTNHVPQVLEIPVVRQVQVQMPGHALMMMALPTLPKSKWWRVLVGLWLAGVSGLFGAWLCFRLKR